MEGYKPGFSLKFATVLTGAIFALLPLHALFTTWLGATFGHIDVFRIWKELLLVPLGAAALWLYWRTSKAGSRVNAIILCMAAYTLLNVAVGLWAFGHDKVNATALIYALLINTRFLVFFVVCYELAKRTDWLKQHWKQLVLWPAAVVIAFGLLQQFLLPSDFLTHFGYGPDTIAAVHTVDKKPEYIRLQSTLRGPNPLGAYLLVVITLLSALWLKRKSRKTWQGLGLVAAGTVLFFTYSRSAWLGTACSLLLLGYWVLRTRYHMTVLLGGSILGVVLLGAFMLGFRNNDILQNTLFHTDETSQSPESSNAVRAQALKEGAKSVLREPLGRGPGTAGPASFRNDYPPRIAENYFIQIGQEIGVFGLVVFVAINVLVGRELWRRREDTLARALLASLAGLTVVNLISHAWADDTLSLIWWGLAGIALATPVTGILKR